MARKSTAAAAAASKPLLGKKSKSKAKSQTKSKAKAKKDPYKWMKWGFPVQMGLFTVFLVVLVAAA